MDASQSTEKDDSGEKTPLKPVLLELIRTQHCDAALTLLLDKIHIVVSNEQYSDEDAYRIWFSDGTRTIQALLTPDLHPFLTAGDVREGSIVVLTKYKLLRAAKYRRDSWVWVLVVSDMEVADFDGRPDPGMLLEFRSKDETATSMVKVDVDEVQVEDSVQMKDSVQTKDSVLVKDSIQTKASNGSGEEQSDTTPRQRKSKKRKLESKPDRRSSSKSKIQKTDTSPSSSRSVLKETSFNQRLKTPIKAIKTKNVLDYGSPQRSLPWLEQLQDGER